MKNSVLKIFTSLAFVLFFVKGVYAQNTPPTFTSTPITSIDQNATYTYSITTNDADGNAVALTASTLPSWLSLTSTTSTIVSTLAGSGTAGFADGTGTAAQFNYPRGVGVDASGNVYVAATFNHRVRKITPAGVVTTLAGSGTAGFADGTGTAAQFNHLEGVDLDASGTVYVADIWNNRIRKITPSGVVTTMAGSTFGFADGTGTAALFAGPIKVAVDASGTVYVSDQNNHSIRKITPAGVVTTLAGSGTAGYADGTGTAAQFDTPSGIAVDGSGNVYVSDQNNNRIRKITPAGVVTTLAGSGVAHFTDGTGTAAEFDHPRGIDVDVSGNVYVAAGPSIRKITPAGVVTTLAGTHIAGFTDGTGTVAQFNNCKGVTVDASGTVYVADGANQRIRKITQLTTYTLSGVANVAPGAYPVVLHADDGNGGTVDQNFTITINDIPPTVTTLVPADNATGVLIASDLVLTFSENVQKGTGNILIKDAADNSTVQTIDVTTSAVSISSAVVTINPPVDLSSNKNYYIQIPNTAFTDISSNAYAGIADMTTWNFATAGVNTPPSFTSTPITSIDENQTYTYNITTHDADGNAVTLTAPTLPSWLSLTVVSTTVNTLAGSGTAGFADGTGTAAQFNSPFGVAVEGSGIIYVADQTNNRIRKITPAGVVTTLAGSGTAGFADATGTAAQFNHPVGIAVDGAGIIYVADQNNNRIRKITPAGVVTTLAGSGIAGFADGTGTAAQFNHPAGIAVDASGIVYVADQTNNRIRKITPAGVVTTLAGSGTAGFADATGTAAQFNQPIGIAVDASGLVYVADLSNNRIRKITLAGVVSTLAGSGTAGFSDGTGTAAQFNIPAGIAVDGAGTIYVADFLNNRIRKITPAGVVTTLAGSTAGFADGTSTAAQFNGPAGIVVDGSDAIYVSDQLNSRIRKIIQNKVLTGDTTGKAGTHNVVLNANDGNGGTVDQSFTITVNDITAPLLTTLVPADNATGVLIGSNLVLTFNENVQKGTGNILIKDAADNSTVQTIDVTTSVVGISNAVVTINPPADLLGNKNYYIQIPATAFTDMASNAYAGIADTTTWNFATVVAVNNPPAFTSTPTTSIGENQTYTYSITTVDADNDAVTLTATTLPSWLSLTATSTVNVSTFAGDGTRAFLDGTGTAAQFDKSSGVALDASGNIYVADYFNHRVRKITPAGVVTTLAGSSLSGSTDGTGSGAKFVNPTDVAVDGSGNVYVCDRGASKIRKITPAGVVTTLAGSGAWGSTDGTGTAAKFFIPSGIAVDGSGTVYVADTNNHRIRKITPSGVVTTLAGSTSGFADGTGTAAQFNSPAGIAVDASGTVYVADSGNNRIRKITPSGVVTTFAGAGLGYADGIGTAALFSNPSSLTLDSSGNIYVADTNNSKIRKITPSGVVTTLAGTTSGYLDGIGTVAKFSVPKGVAINSLGEIYVADYNDGRIRKLTQSTTYNLTGTAPVGAGSYPVVLHADDGNGGTIDQNFTITVTVLNTPPTFTSTPITSIDENQTYTYSITTVDADNDAVTLTATTLPSWLSLTTSHTTVVSTLAGSGAGFAEGTGATAQFSFPQGVAVDASGIAYVADRVNHRIRKITPAGVVSTLAGSTAGFADGTGTAAQFFEPTGVAV
ncbi:MAG: SMP-30/gluconolactonase/LRE family protein, partial [Flavobacteriaceae bacterium]|nr:SMP-30/gluconolactonase/LRE family protein [Flavobacteriaceae bacterium]